VEQIHRLIVKPKFVYACVFAGALMLCGCTGNKSAEAAGNTPGGGGQGGPGSKGGTKGGGFGGPVSVMVAKAVTRDVPIQAEVIGNVEASSAVTLRPQISGQITQAFFTEGEFVNKGKLLLTIDKRALEAQMKQLEAQISKDEAALNQAIANLARDKAQEGNAGRSSIAPTSCLSRASSRKNSATSTTRPSTVSRQPSKRIRPTSKARKPPSQPARPTSKTRKS